jgi:hypothetical protein
MWEGGRDGRRKSGRFKKVVVCVLKTHKQSEESLHMECK